MTLPVEDAVEEVRAALVDPGAAVLVAPPGSGKSTVIPLRLLGEPWAGAEAGRIVVLQPRRVATRAVAARLAWHLGEDVGETVGYRTRDDARVGPGCRIEVVTEGILTRRLQSDPSLPGIAAVLFDEVHERNLQTDLGLALTLEVRRTIRPDLRVLAMSATLAAGKVAALLGGPIVTAEGSPHPVDVWWAPPPRRERVVDAVPAAVRRALADPTTSGDVLVFLPGVGEIDRVLTDLQDVDADVLALHGSLPPAEQDRALSTAARRRVVLATDIAETSLTVEGVQVVVDAGLAREPALDARTGMTRLRTVPASKASADQRAGRAGRLGPGVAWRLWSQVEHAARRPFAEPEILRVDLAALALELDAWGGDAAALPWLDPPPRRAMEDARALLAQLGLLDAERGRAAASLPVHPRLARMVLDAPVEDRWAACVLATVLEGRPPPGDDADISGRLDRYDQRRARDLARRAGVDTGGAVDPQRFGRLLALAFPDRIGQAKGGPGRFRLRGGSAAWVPASDSLARAPFVVAADLDGKRAGARIRLGAAIELDDVLQVGGDAVREHRSTGWDRDRDDLVERVARTLDRLDLGTVVRPAPPSDATTAALVDHARRSRLAALPMAAADSLRARVSFLRGLDPERWPDLSDATLLRRLDEWLAPFLAGATSRRDVEIVDVVDALAVLLPAGAHGELDRLAPESLALPSGRRVAVDYGAEAGPAVAARVQDLYGISDHPTVGAGRVPVVVHLLSPAGRPVQVTSDLPRFWSGSWRDVRRELAGRYPKHDWPEDPTTRR